MNILHIASGDLWAGAEAQIFYTLKEIKKKSQYNLRVILFNNGELCRRLQGEGVNVVVVDENVKNSFLICYGIKKELNRNMIEIVHVHDYKSHVLSALGLMFSQGGVKLVRTIHGQTTVLFGMKNLKSWIVLKLDKVFLKYFSFCLVAVSKDLFSYLTREKINSNIVQIDNGISPNAEITVRREDVRREYGIPDNTLWIGTAARLESIKNIEMLINSARILVSEHKDVQFCMSVFGDGQLREHLQGKIAKLGLTDKVFLHGHRDDIMPVLNALDVFTLTSKHEGLPMSLLEAMSLGTVPVCTAVGGMKEVITYGVDGFLVESDDAGGLAEILADIYCRRDNLASIQNNAREKVKHSYSVGMSTGKLLSLYGEILQA